MIDKMTVQSDIIKTALQASVVRNDVILNNIANADTPGFKKKRVVFEDVLQNVLKTAKLTGELDLDSAVAGIKVTHPYYNYRLDENNVDIETEMVDLFQNSIKYDTMIGSVVNNYRRINLVITGR